MRDYVVDGSQRAKFCSVQGFLLPKYVTLTCFGRYYVFYVHWFGSCNSLRPKPLNRFFYTKYVIRHRSVGDLDN